MLEGRRVVMQPFLGMSSFLAVILFLIHLFFALPVLITLYSLISVVLLIAALNKMDRANRIVLSILLLSGGILFYVHKVDGMEILYSFGENLHLLGLFLLIPLFGTFMSQAGYLGALERAIRKREQGRKAHPYRLGFLLTASIGSLLNLGSMPLVHKIGSETFSYFGNKRFSLTLLRGFGFCMLWSPYFVNVGLVLVLYDISWHRIGGYGIMLAIVYAVLVWCFFPSSAFKDEKWVENMPDGTRATEHFSCSLKGFFLYVTILILLSFLLEMILPVSMLTVVSILAVFYPLVWSIWMKQTRSYIQDAALYISTSFGRLYNEIGIFITAGFFGEALSRSKAGEWLSAGILSLSGGLTPVFVFILISTVMLLAFIGIHPVIIIVGLGSSLSPEQFGVAPSFMAVLMLSAWLLGTQNSPFSGSVLMAAHLMNETPWNVVKKNKMFILTTLLVFTVLLSVIDVFQSL